MTVISFPDDKTRNPYLYWHSYSPNGQYLLIVYLYSNTREHGVYLVDFIRSTNRKISSIRSPNEVFVYWLSDNNFVIVSSFLKEYQGTREYYQISDDAVTLKKQKKPKKTRVVLVEQLDAVAPSIYKSKTKYILESIEYSAYNQYSLKVFPKNPDDIKCLPKKNIFIQAVLLTSFPGARLYDWVVLSIGSRIIFPMIENSTNCLLFLSIDLTPFFTGRETMNILKEDVEARKVPELPSEHSWMAGFYEDDQYIIFRTEYNEQNYVNVILKEPFIFGISFASYMVSFTEEQKALNLHNVAIHPNGKFVGLFIERQTAHVIVQEIKIKNKPELQSLRSLATSAAVSNLFRKVKAPTVDFSNNNNLQFAAMQVNVPIEKEKNRFTNVCGYEKAFFGYNHSVIYTVQNFIKHIDLNSDIPEVQTIYVNGIIETASPSPDYSCFCISYEDDGNPKVVIYSAENYEKKFIFASKFVANTLVISQASEVLVSLAVTEERVYLNTFDLKEGVASCSGELLSENTTTSWQLSICPADEGVVCALGGTTAYLLRCTNGYIENFSSINLTDVTCHGWSNDVTMAFGTNDGKLRLYRETIALEIVDIRECCQNIKESPSIKILHISTSLRSFGVFIEGGIILTFSVDSNGPVWNEAKSLVITLNSQNDRELILNYDSADELLLYSTGSQLKYSSLKYSSVISEDFGISIAAAHTTPVALISTNKSWIVSMDQNTLINVVSVNTGRSIVQQQLTSAMHFMLVESDIMVVTAHSIDKYLITMGGLFLQESIYEVNPKKCCDSTDSKFLAVVEAKRVIVFSVIDWKIILDERLVIKNEIKKVVFSGDAKFLVLLTQNDNILCLDVTNGKTIWTLDYKLQFFTDIAFTNQTVYLLDQTLVLTRIKHGKALSTVNVHAAEVGYSCCSLNLATNQDNIYVSTDNGSIIKCGFNQLDNPRIIKPSTKCNVSYMRCVQNNLLIGYADGSVALMNDHSSEKIIDWISCDFSTVVNLNHCLRSLDHERNMIRKETNDLVTAYKEARDKEVEEMKEEYSANMKAMRERIKRFEDNFEESESSKAKTIAHLQHLYQQEVKLQNEQFEKTLKEQMQKTLQLEEENKNTITEKDIQLEHSKLHLIDAFRETEIKLEDDNKNLVLKINELNENMEKLKKYLHFVENSKEKSALENQTAVETVKTKRREEVEMLEQEIWNLKTVAAQLKLQQDTSCEDLQIEKNAHNITKNLTKMATEETKQLNSVIQQLKSRTTALERNEVDLKRANAKQNQKCQAMTQELEDLKTKHHRVTRRCGELEARIDRLGECVYDARRLEHCTLSLIAFMQNIDTDEKFRLPK